MKDLLTSALDAHGGLSLWRELEAFRLNVSIEREAIETVLADARGQVGGPKGAAAKLGIPRQNPRVKNQNARD